jgi:putative hemolysin
LPELPSDTPASAPFAEILSIVICVFLSGLFSGSETVLTSLTEARIMDLMSSPKRWGTKRLQHWLRNSTRILTSLLIGNNLVNIIGSILAAKVAYHYLESYADAVAVGVMTLLVLIFGEIIPKTIGKLWYSKMAPWAMLFALVVDRLFYPLAWLLNGLARFVFRRIEAASDSASPPMVTEGEIEHMILKGEEEGVLDKDRGELMRSVLEFKDTIAKEIMIPHGRIVAISADASIEKAYDIAISSGHSRIPVYSGKIDNIEGLLYSKDLITVKLKGMAEPASVRDLVRKPPFFVPETKKVSELLSEMQKKRVHLAVVLDEFGSTSGVITLEDIVEEIVGEIRDEYDHEEAPIWKGSDGAWEAQAWISIYELGEALGTDIPDTGEYETLGGFLINLYGSVPKAGKSLMWNNFRFTVTDSDNKRISTVKIESLSPPFDSDDSSPIFE